MASYHKWDVKIDFAYVLQFLSLISEGLGCVHIADKYRQKLENNKNLFL